MSLEQMKTAMWLAIGLTFVAFGVREFLTQRRKEKGVARNWFDSILYGAAGLFLVVSEAVLAVERA